MVVYSLMELLELHKKTLKWLRNVTAVIVIDRKEITIYDGGPSLFGTPRLKLEDLFTQRVFPQLPVKYGRLNNETFPHQPNEVEILNLAGPGESFSWVLVIDRTKLPPAA